MTADSLLGLCVLKGRKPSGGEKFNFDIRRGTIMTRYTPTIAQRNTNKATKVASLQVALKRL